MSLPYFYDKLYSQDNVSASAQVHESEENVERTPNPNQNDAGLYEQVSKLNNTEVLVKILFYIPLQKKRIRLYVKYKAGNCEAHQ